MKRHSKTDRSGFFPGGLEAGLNHASNTEEFPTREYARLAWHTTLRMKYMRGARYAWLPVPPEPPEPK